MISLFLFVKWFIKIREFRAAPAPHPASLDHSSSNMLLIRYYLLMALPIATYWLSFSIFIERYGCCRHVVPTIQCHISQSSRNNSNTAWVISCSWSFPFFNWPTRSCGLTPLDFFFAVFRSLRFMTTSPRPPTLCWRNLNTVSTKFSHIYAKRPRKFWTREYLCNSKAMEAIYQSICRSMYNSSILYESTKKKFF